MRTQARPVRHEDGGRSPTPERPNQIKSNSDLVNELIANLNGLAHIDLSSFANSNLSHLLKATNHLKLAQSEFQMAK